MVQTEGKTKKVITRTIDQLWPVNFQLMVVPGGFGKNGIPDHLACVPVTITAAMVGMQYGMFVAVEAKTPKGTTSGIQKVRIAEIIKASGFAAVVYGAAGAEHLEQSLRYRFNLGGDK